MTFQLRRILSRCAAAHAFTMLILMTPNDALTQDRSERDGADQHRNTEVRQRELPDPEFSPHGPFLGPLDIAHIARFSDLPQRMFLEPHLIPPASIRTLESQSVLHGKFLAYEKRGAAARAMRVLAPDKAFAEAQLFTGGSVLDRLLGIELLSSAKPEAHTGIFLLCADDSDGVASAAWTALFRLNPDALIPAVPTGRDHRDAFVRMTAARMMRLFPDVECSEWLNEQLSDKHLEVRNVAREMSYLVAEEQAPLRDGIIAIASNTLTANPENWQGIEQSLLLLGQLRAAQFSGRCVPLLEHPRNEVLVTAAWLLHLFPDPAGEEAVRKRLMRNEEMLRNPALAPAGADLGLQSSYLIQYAGLMRLKDMQTFLTPNFSKSAPGGPFKRTAAMWTLGLFHENEPQPELVKSFLERLADRGGPPPVPPEQNNVRRMSTVALGLMRAKTAVPGLLEAYQIDSPETVIPDSARWSLGMTGEPLPNPLKAKLLAIGGWRLSPVED